MKKQIYPVIILIIGLFFSGVPLRAQAMTSAQAQEHFQKGNTFYKEGAFAEACSEYSAICGAGLASGEIYFNIGNCYARRGMMGLALVNYERARLYKPQDSDLKSNYGFVRSELALTGVTQGLQGRILDAVNEALPFSTMQVIVLIAYALIFVCIGLAIVFASQRKIIIGILVAIILVTITGSAAWFRRIIFIDRGAIVIAQNIPARFEPAEEGTVYYTLTEGSRIEILESTGSWAKVLRSDGKIGWIKDAAFEKIMRDKTL
ncbi:MAG TPA: SH3 domain-containing protein [Candidatus Omnitrophota bacterium]|nr:SH3 domain-containing protein [Candidatus Omnitrophota bacterium]